MLHLSPDESQIKLKLLHPPGPSNSFRYPPSEHTVTIAVKDVLTMVDLRTRSGRVYAQKEVKSASEKLERDIYYCSISITVCGTILSQYVCNCVIIPTD